MEGVRLLWNVTIVAIFVYVSSDTYYLIFVIR